MDQSELPSVQGDPRSKRHPTAVLAVANDGQVPRRQLDTNLVLATGDEGDFQQDQVARSSQRAVGQLGVHGTRCLFPANQHFLQPLVFSQPVLPRAGVGYGRRGDQGPIRLLHFPRAELLGQATGSLGRASQNDGARDRGIEAADDPQIDLARFPVLVLDVLPRERQQTGPVWIDSHGRQLGRFRHGQQMIILQEYLKWRMNHEVTCRMFEHEPLILASQSPRRRQLLEEAGYDFQVMVPSDQAECGVCSGETPMQLVARLAYQKAADIAKRVPQGTVIGCDTVAECLGQVLGKPRDESDARQMLRLLRGREHRVLSGLCIWIRPADHVRVEVAATRLRMAIISDEALEEYLATGVWEGKAGAFGYQDGVPWIEVLSGSESNVVGLPLELLDRLLTRMQSHEDAHETE